MEAVSKYMENPGPDHWIVMKWIIHVFKGFLQFYLLWWIKSRVDWLCGCRFYRIWPKEMYSLSALFTRDVVSWLSKLHFVVALSTTESVTCQPHMCIKEVNC